MRRGFRTPNAADRRSSGKLTTGKSRVRGMIDDALSQEIPAMSPRRHGKPMLSPRIVSVAAAARSSLESWRLGACHLFSGTDVVLAPS